MTRDWRYATRYKRQIETYAVRVWNALWRHRVQIAVVLLGLLVLALRRPGAIVHPQFFAEDGRIWLQDALNNGHSVFALGTSYAGYLAVYSRLVACVSGLFPLELAPLLFLCAALFVQLLPLVYIWSKRAGITDNRIKLFATFFYLCMPFTDEIHAGLAFSQWDIALLMFILIFIKESQGRYLRWFERILLLVTALDGPFAIVIAPILAFDAWRSKRLPFKYKIVFAGAIIQAASIVLSLGDRAHENIGPSVTALLNIIGGQIFGAGLFGAMHLHVFLSKPWIVPVISVIGIEFLLYVFIKSNKLVRYFLLYGAGIFLSSLASPDGVPIGSTWWQVLGVEGVGGRYMFILHVALFVCLGWTLFTKVKISRLIRASAVLVVVASILIGVRADFRHMPRQDLHYQSYIKQYHNLKPGQRLVVPTNPGPPWQFVLTKGN